jgi:tetratricopeptide (TPR) repeat protein
VRDDTPSTWVLWIHAASAARLEQSVRQNLEDLTVPKIADKAANAFQLLRNWLLNSKNGKWLLILDNVDDAQFLLEPPPTPKQKAEVAQHAPHHDRILEYFPASNHGSILVTSRTTDAALKVVERRAVIAVEPMGAEHAVQLLGKKLDCEYTLDEALELTKALDHMPLAINQAAAYISQEWPLCSVQQYLEKLSESEKSKLSLLDLNEGDLRRDKEATNSIISTWQISFERIRATRRSASDLLSLMSFFDRQSIPQSLLHKRQTAVHPDKRTTRNKDEPDMSCKSVGITPEAALEDLRLDIRMLRNYSFISAATAHTFTMHSLVQLATRKWLRSRSEEEQWMRSSIDLLVSAIPEEGPPGAWEHWGTYALLSPHAKAIQNLQPANRDSALARALILYYFATYSIQRRSSVEARAMATVAFDVYAELLGLGSELTLKTMLLLGHIANKDGFWAEAERLGKRALAISSRKFEENSPMVTDCKLVLAQAYGLQGYLTKAQDLQIEMVETAKRLRAEDAYTVAKMGDLAETYYRRGMYEKAAELGAEALEMGTKVLGHEHPATAHKMSWLAQTYHDRGLYDKAAELGAEAVERSKRALGLEHQDTITSMWNTARTLASLKVYDKAIPLMTQALQLSGKVRGHEHPYTLLTMCDLSLVYRDQGSYDKAIELGSEAFERSRTTLGPEHRDTHFTIMAEFAVTLYEAGRLQSAGDLMEVCASKSLAVLGPTHPKTVERRQMAAAWRKELEEQEDVQDNAAKGHAVRRMKSRS